MNSGNRPPAAKAAPRLEELRHQFTVMLQESDRRGAQRLLREALGAGYSPSQLLKEVVSPAIDTTARSWAEHHELSLSQIYVAGLIIKDAADLLSVGREAGEKPVGKIVIGVAEGDHHGLGRLLVSAFLRSAGFDVIDLGLTVSPKAFVDTALAEGADIIAISALMVEPAMGIREVRREMERRGIKHIPLLVGGAPFRYNPELVKLVGADATAPNAYEAITVARRLLEEKRRGQ